METYIVMAVSAIFVNNILLAQGLGSCPYLGTSKSMDTAIGMAMAVIFVLVMAGAATWIADHFLLKPCNIEFLRTLVFILIIASLVQFVEMFMKKSVPSLYAGLGIFLPLITTNCAVMGACLMNINEEYDFLTALINATFLGAGFGLALILFAGVRERIILNTVPEALTDTAIGLVTAGFISLAFMGFQGLG